MTFLRERVMKESRVGCMLGPPGTGKSLTALAFASMLDLKVWTVTWIHVSRRSYPFCVRIQEDSRSTRALQRHDYYDELYEILHDEVDENKNHIVILDGMTIKHVEEEKMCVAWRKQNETNRRLVIVSSMSSRWKAKSQEDRANGIEKFKINSWTESEYLEAIEDDSFFKNICCNLDSSCVPDLGSVQRDSKRELVLSKFYYAGGSARFMFEFTTDNVIEDLDDSIAEVPNALKLATGEVGLRSNGVINRLFSSYVGTNGKEKVIPVSRYAASELAIIGGPTLIKNIASILHQDWNPAIDGWALEMLFFANL